MIAFIIGAIVGVALALLGGVLMAGYHLWRRRGDEAEWAACDPDCECQR